MSINKYNPTTGELELLAGGGNDVLYADSPIGSIIPYGGTTAPDGFLLCRGQAISRTTYAELFKVIGTAFGSGDGSTTFNVPDLREATTKGVGLSGKSNNHFDNDGIALGEFVEDRVQAHTHSHKIGSSTAGSEEWVMFATSQVISGISQTDYGVVGRFGNTTEVKAVGVNYIIKAKQVDAPADFAPVDVVEDGNMKAVTSNAVAKITNHTNELVWNTEYVDLGQWSSGGLFERCGFVLLDKILMLKANCPTGALLCTGFPRPIVGMEISVSFDNAQMGGGLFLDTNGDLRAYVTHNENNESFRVNFIYMKNL